MNDVSAFQTTKDGMVVSSVSVQETISNMEHTIAYQSDKIRNLEIENSKLRVRMQRAVQVLRGERHT